MIRKSSLALVLLCAACSSTTAPPATDAASAALAATPAGANVASWIAGLNTNMASLQSNANADVAAAAPLLQNALALGSSLDTAFQMLAPAFGASASDVANEQKAVATLNALAANPPTNVAAAAANAIAASLTIKGAVAKIAPAAANATAPVAASATATSAP